MNVDDWVESYARRLARLHGRRGFLARLGVFFTGAAAIPLLPVMRGLAAAGIAHNAEGQDEDIDGAQGDPTKCEYWRHCAIDGFLCSCCGGSQTACPPGTEMAPVSWIGTCRNPADGKNYAIWYNDCCGRGMCGRCFCNRNEGDRPIYHPYRSNDINWCGGTSSQIYHCSTALIIGLTEEAQPEK